MSEHEQIRALLPLVAADALDEADRRRADAHLAQCEVCRRDLAAFELLAATLRQAPTPQPRPELVQRVQAMAVAKFAAQQKQPEAYWMLPLLVLASWGAMLATWPLLNSAASGVLHWLNLPPAGAWKWAMNYLLITGTLATMAAMILVLRIRTMGREK